LNYSSDTVEPAFMDYFDAIVALRNDFFSINRTIYSEFGRAWVGKSAVVVATVEDVLIPPSVFTGIPLTAITHAGADIFLRPVRFNAYTYSSICF
jgi:diaminopimelate decarboxylase